MSFEKVLAYQVFKNLNLQSASVLFKFVHPCFLLYVFAVLLKLPFNVLRGYFYGSLNFVTVFTV